MNRDLLYAVMKMCVKAKSGCPSEMFIQSVQAAPEPLSVLALEQQLLKLILNDSVLVKMSSLSQDLTQLSNVESSS